MKYCVCIKQVADVDAPIRVVDGTLSFDTGRMVLNAYDASAVEEALVLCEKYGGEVDVVLIGPEKAQETLRKALAMGAARATHIRCEEGAVYDSRAYARRLARFFADRTYDVIACGKQAQDTDAGLTGGMLAEMLGLPYATNAVGLDAEDGHLVVTRQGDSGEEVIALPVPCLVTCSNDMNDPRNPNIKGIMQARRKPIEVEDAGMDPQGEAPQTRIVRYEDVPERTPGRMLDGEPDETVEQLVQLLANEAKVL